MVFKRLILLKRFLMGLLLKGISLKQSTALGWDLIFDNTTIFVYYKKDNTTNEKL